MMKFLYLLIFFIYFANCDLLSKSPINNSGTKSADDLLSEVISKLELKLESLINENMNKLEETIKQMNTFNQLMLKMDHLTISKMEDELNLVNNKYKCSNLSIPRSCDHFKGCDSNIYKLILPEVNHEPFAAACDLKTLNGGWTIIQRRQDGSENFYRNWSEYAEGFGNVNGEFFIGLNKLHALTSSEDPQELYIMLEDFEGGKRYARYGKFKIDSENNGFKLTVDEYSGDAGDDLAYQNGMKFSTRDRDNDISDYNCAEYFKGAWWYKKCFFSNLNGQYYHGVITEKQGGISWSLFRGPNYSLKFTQMMIRTRNN